MIDIQINDIIASVLLDGQHNTPHQELAAEATASILALLAPTEVTGDLTPVQRAHDAVVNLSSLLRAFTGPDDAIATLTLEEGAWLEGQLLTQRREEDVIVAEIAKELFVREHPDRTTDDATEEETERYFGHAYATVSLAALCRK